MKNKTVTVKDYFDGTKDLTRLEYIDTFQQHSLWLLRDYEDMENTSKMYDDIKSRIDTLASHKFDLLYARQQMVGQLPLKKKSKQVA